MMETIMRQLFVLAVVATVAASAAGFVQATEPVEPGSPTPAAHDSATPPIRSAGATKRRGLQNRFPSHELGWA